MARLAKHFEHRLSVSRDERTATVTFPDGVCTLSASDQELDISIESSVEDSLSRFQEVVTRHLKQVASQESFEIEWKREGNVG
jgi:uncharacterized protein